MAGTAETFSYAEPTDPRLKRFIIRMIERMTGQPHLKSLYEDRVALRRPGESFWDLALRLLDIRVAVNEDALWRMPKTGALVIVANHPFGVLDGVIVCHLVARVRDDFRILTNAVLNRADEVKEFLLPVDFTESDTALETNIKSRAAAKRHLIDGGCLIVFPAGGVSTTPSVWHRRATDAEWKNLTARLISQAKAPVVPIYFAGQNSRLFQLASHLSMTFRLSLLFKEVHDRIGSEMAVHIGDAIPFERIADIADRQELMNYLREQTYALGKKFPGDAPKTSAAVQRDMTAKPRVGLFVTCLVDLMRPQVGFAAVKLLQDAGCEVIVPSTQTCCGQPAWNSGADKHAVAIAKQVIDTFEVFDYVVAPSGSCAGMLRKHYPEVLAEDAMYAPRARALAVKSYELLSFLVNVRKVERLSAACPTKICYHDSCSALREMNVKTEPRKLLASVEGVSLSELSDPEACCGFGGLFSVKYPAISERMADDKIRDVKSTGADLLIGPDLGCLLHLTGRMQREGKTMRVRHAAEVLAGMTDVPAMNESRS